MSLKRNNYKLHMSFAHINKKYLFRLDTFLKSLIRLFDGTSLFLIYAHNNSAWPFCTGPGRICYSCMLTICKVQSTALVRLEQLPPRGKLKLERHK
jgi:predicted dithiol-disulfide oxidoreductase (DUF899 family)